jgi:FkbM family methyltransferase
MKTSFHLSREVWVYGSGTFAVSIICELEHLGHSILGVIDHANVGSLVQGCKENYKVLHFSDSEVGSEDQVVLGVCNLHGDLKNIASQFQAEIQLITPVKLFQYFSEKGVSRENYWLTTDFEIYSECVAEIQEFRNSLSDQDSKHLLDSILKYRQAGELEHLSPPRPLAEQYLARDLGTPPRELMIIDLGACQGENLKAFLDSGCQFTGGYLLEPDETNLQILDKELIELGIKALSTHKLGAWKESTTLKFDASGNTGASFKLGGSHTVDVVALDDFVSSDFVPNFVKMDIEGAEMEALEGMVGLIQRHRPHLAISVYHKPSDLWELGNFITRNFPEKYDFHLRVYGHQTFDTLLYAVPKA